MKTVIEEGHRLTPEAYFPFMVIVLCMQNGVWVQHHVMTVKRKTNGGNWRRICTATSPTGNSCDGRTWK